MITSVRELIQELEEIEDKDQFILYTYWLEDETSFGDEGLAAGDQQLESCVAHVNDFIYSELMEN